MKILLVNTYHYRRGGDCTYTFALADLLRSRGDEVRFFGMRHPRNLPCADERYFVDEIDFPKELAAATPAAALNVLGRSIWSRQARERFARLLDDARPDLVHLQSIHGHITPSILEETDRRNLPVVWTLHDYRVICPNTHLVSHGKVCEACKGGRFFSCTVRRCKKGSILASAVASLEGYVHRWRDVRGRVSRFISPSRFLKRKLEEFGWDGGNIEHLGYFLPESLLSAPAPERGSYALYFGQLAAHKGVRTLLRAVREVPDLPLRIGGEGPDRPVLEGMVRDLGLQQVSFEGHLTGEPLQALLRGASFVVVPSEWYENSPLAVPEAMVLGKPVIASDIGGLPELVNDGEDGFLVPAGDPQALAEALRRMQRDPALAARLGRRARERALEEHGSERHYRSIQQVYGRVIAGASSRTGSR